ncbi:MAG: DUF4349 domain-containing protein [Clostridiales bacterium]|nr:DUF4349 domain-containing protein [Clostridiales bacterium]
MRKFLTAAIFAICFIFLSTTPTHASPDRHYRRVSDITIRVESVEAAIFHIRALAGQNLSSSVELSEAGFAWANFERRVPATAHPQVMQTLRSLGEVLSESENTMYLGGEIRDLQARLSANELEILRLTILMENAANLNVLMAIDTNLSRAQRERDNLMGRLNYLNSTAGQPHINIFLTEPGISPLGIEIEPLTFWQRMGASFTGSLTVILAGFGHFLVFLALAAVPLAILGVLALFAILLFRRLNRPKIQVKEVEADEAILNNH